MALPKGVSVTVAPVKSLVPTVGSIRLHALCIFFAIGSFMWGYTIGILATVYVNPGFIKELHHPNASKQGLITAIYYLGTWVCYVFIASPTSDRLGRRWAVFIGAVIVCFGAALLTGARGHDGFAMLIIGRIISGFGTALISTSVPMYQRFAALTDSQGASLTFLGLTSEISPAKKRGFFVVMNHIGLVAGLSAAFWVGYGMSFWKHHNGFHLAWRLSIAVQFIPAVFLLAGLPFCPETPRWLIEKGRMDDAKRSLQWIRGAKDDDEGVLEEIDQIQEAMEIHHANGEPSWKQLFTNKDLFARMWRVALLQFMSQMCGSTAMKYYLPTNFIALGLSKQFALLAGGIESSLKVGCTVIEMILIDRLGRKATLILGSSIMSIALLINGVLPQVYPHNINHASDYACIVFIFFFTFGYSIGFGPNSWVYGSEIFPTHIRAKGLSISASGGSIGSIVVAQIWPVAFQRIGSKTYFIFMSTNIASILILAIWYPETKGKTLEEMDNLFGNAKIDTEYGPRDSFAGGERHRAQRVLSEQEEGEGGGGA